MNNSSRQISLYLTVLVLAACGDDDTGTSETADVTETGENTGPVDDEEIVEISIPTTPRGYLMGMQALAYERSIEAEDTTWNYVGGHADVVMVVLDRGVPWAELLDDEPFPSGLESDLAELDARMESTTVDLFLAVDLFAPDRTGIAPDIRGAPLPSGFDGASVGDVAVREAYTRYCERLVERYEPAYFAPVLDLNVYLQNRPTDYDAAVAFYKELREDIKRVYALAQVFPTWDLEIMAGLGPVSNDEQFAEIRLLEANVDRLALSVRPATHFIKLDALTRDYIGRAEEYSVRPLVVISAFPSVGFANGPLIYASSENSQYNYLAFLLQDAEAGAYDLVVWQYPYDTGNVLEDLCPGRLAAAATPCDDDVRFDALRPYETGGLLMVDGTRKVASDLWNDFFTRMYLP
jgi:hypothetical protein